MKKWLMFFLLITVTTTMKPGDTIKEIKDEKEEAKQETEQRLLPSLQGIALIQYIQANPRRLQYVLRGMEAISLARKDMTDLVQGAALIFALLNKLSFQHIFNQHYCTPFDDMRSLVRIRSLDVSHNRLEALPPEISELTELEELRAIYNQLKELPNELCELRKLRVLDVRFNNLRSLLPQLEELPLLTSLKVEGNPPLQPEDYNLVLRNLARHDKVGLRKNEEIDIRILRGEAAWKHKQAQAKKEHHS